jgi:hypothetical protein
MADLGYQNPGTTNAQLDSRVVGSDPGGTGVERRRELVESPTQLELLQQILLELRAIKIGIATLATNSIAQDTDFVLDNFQDSYTK